MFGEQDEFFEEEHKAQIVRDGFAYLRDTPVPSVTEAKKMLQKDLMEGAGHLTRTRTLTLTLYPNPNPNPNP